jgi:hypothetical protein
MFFFRGLLRALSRVGEEWEEFSFLRKLAEFSLNTKQMHVESVWENFELFLNGIFWGLDVLT